jgi:hypothetical protein
MPEFRLRGDLFFERYSSCVCYSVCGQDEGGGGGVRSGGGTENNIANLTKEKVIIQHLIP